MAQIVGAFGTSHVLLERKGFEEQADRVFDGMMKIRRRIDELDPDIVVLVGDDHFINFNLAYEIPFAIPVMDEMVPAGDAGLPRTPFKGDPAFSGGMVDYLNDHDFEITTLREYQLCHGFTVPSFFTAPRRTRTIAPVVTNIMREPPVKPSRCYRLGRLIGDYIREKRPANERVVVVGTGGLTHWVAVEGQGEMSFDFDRKVFDLFAAGRAEELSHMTAEQILEEGGNGGLELINWIIMAGTVHGMKGEKVYYEAMPDWWTGMSGLEVRV